MSADFKISECDLSFREAADNVTGFLACHFPSLWRLVGIPGEVHPGRRQRYEFAARRLVAASWGEMPLSLVDADNHIYVVMRRK
ncbi:hypothetical protein [Streptosporangium roseum]|uniref:hypothetical protein n=1 Tax=Streptosporangium roseum TaxID=2001 RepID=UPI00331904A4